MPASSTEMPRTGWRLTGTHVLAMMVGFFGIIITTSIIFTVLAVQSFRGEDVKGSYRQGLDYNTTLSERAEQGGLGWKASVNTVGTLSERALIVKISDGSRTIDGLVISGRLRHPVDSNLDRPVEFDVQADGIARADISGLMGQWTVEAVAQGADKRFKFQRDLDLR